MSEAQASPISQILLSMGITREDLVKRTDDMRHFLNTQTPSISRVSDTINSLCTPSGADNSVTRKPISSSSSFTRSRSRANSHSFRDASPSSASIKSEPVEGSIPAPLRGFGSMEEVLERQRRQNRRDKKEKRDRERDSQTKLFIPQASPSPANASQSILKLESPTKSRVDTLVPTRGMEAIASSSSQSDSSSVVPITPQRSKYYREHTNLGYSLPSRAPTPVKLEPPSASRSSPFKHAPPAVQPQYIPYTEYIAYASLLPPLGVSNTEAGPSTIPCTPQKHRPSFAQNSPLPPSSPPPSSPVVTPSRPSVNLVSSPGPMGPLPAEDEYDKLPYTLPPGPYSSTKPELSYAALVGQAILSSPHHRLTLQEIYDWITIVYPYFKRGETTWMNSIRHVLSTTVVFRKVPRERSVGRTLWAIWDEDLECFQGGGFRKQLCKDFAQTMTSRADPSSKGKPRSKRRVDNDDGTDARKLKRAKREVLAMPTLQTTPYMPAMLSAIPLFPPTRPTTHHQPYYESCIQPQTLPADVIFPPLPAGVAYNRLVALAPRTEPSTKVSEEDKQEVEKEERCSDAPNTTPKSSLPPLSQSSSSSSASSLPDLTPNCSSSSPPPSSSDPVISSVDEVNLDEYITIGCDSDNENEEEKPTIDDNVFTQTLLSPVKDWGHSPKVGDKGKGPELTLGSGFKLELGVSHSSDDEEPLWTRTKGPAKSPNGIRFNKKKIFPPVPTSPTLNRKPSKVSKALPSRKSLDVERPTTPTPSTPPRTSSQLPVSSVRTPLSSKGINPAALYSEGDDDGRGDLELNTTRTPRKRVVSSGTHGVVAPVTPRRLVFPTNQNESPFSTPAGSGVGGIFSPFRTPGSRSVFDPHDPGALLDEELNRMGAAESPAGLFGKGRGSLLYDSPGLSSSPGQYGRWW